MFDQDGATLRSVAWREVCPWLVLFRTFRVAIDLRALLPAAAGVLLTFAGWALLGQMLPPADGQADGYSSGTFTAIDAAVPNRPRILEGFGSQGLDRPMTSVAANPLLDTWVQLTHPLIAVLRPEASASSVFLVALRGLWMLVVWALFGAIIARMAVVRFAADEQVGLMQAFRFAVSKWVSYFFAPIGPICAILLCSLGIFFPALLANYDIPLILAGLIWPIALACGFVMALLLTGLLFGWPLMVGAISAEGSDSFDAWSRSYAYVFQRPLQYLFYAVVAGVFGSLCWVLVSSFAGGIIAMTHWAASWAVSEGRMGAVVGGMENPGQFARVGAGLIFLWVGCVKLLAVGFLYSYFFTVAGAIYLLLRRDADATEMDEVYLDADATGSTFRAAAGSPR